MKTLALTFKQSVRDSKNFDMLSNFPGKHNRQINKNSVKELTESMSLYGFLGQIIFLETKAFGGEVKIYNVDGQHRLEAAKRLGIPFHYEVYELVEDTQDNVTKLISRLNSTAIRWSTKNFLEAQIANNKKDYILLDKIKRETKLTVTDILNVYLGGAGSVEMKIFRSGDMKFENLKESNNLLKSVLLMRDSLPNKSFSRRAMFKVLKSVKDHEKLAKMVSNSSMVFTENECELEKQLLSLYQSNRGNCAKEITEAKSKAA